MEGALDLFLQQLLNGLTIGMIYALIALGYTMVYGVIQLINFAHGEVFMAGAYLAMTALVFFGTLATPLPVWAVFAAVVLFSVVGSAALGAGIERVAYKPLRGSPKLTALITSIGMSFFLQNAVMLVYGAKEQSVPDIFPAGRLEAGPLSVSLLQGVIFAVSIGLMVLLTRFVRHTRTGKALRALAQDPDTARLMGVSVDSMIRLTFVLGSALAAVGGALFGMYYGSVNFHDGYLAGLKAFTAAVFGGIGSIPGAMIGGILLGIFEAMGAGYLSAEWKDVFAFVLLGAVLIFKPSGLLGENVPEKV